MKKFCFDLDIKQRKVSIEAYRSNGRVERVIGKLPEFILKMSGVSFEEQVRKVRTLTIIVNI